MVVGADGMTAGASLGPGGFEVGWETARRGVSNRVDKLPDLDARLESVLLSPRRIAARIRRLGCRIAADYASVDRLYVVGVLKGACIFMADLARSIHRAGGPPLAFEYIRARTYGAEIKVPGEHGRKVRIDGLDESLKNRHVLLVEDILDQGFTLAALQRILLHEQAVASLKICVLLNKRLDEPSPEVAEIRRRLRVDYSGFEIPDRWVAGYGMDVREEFRDLPYVAIVRQ